MPNIRCCDRQRACVHDDKRASNMLERFCCATETIEYVRWCEEQKYFKQRGLSESETILPPSFNGRSMYLVTDQTGRLWGECTLWVRLSKRCSGGTHIARGVGSLIPR